MWNLSDPIPPEPKPEEIYHPCPKCDHGYVVEINYVTRWMALDACEPSMEGMPIEETIQCKNCGGLGYIKPEEDEEIPY